MSSLPQHLDLHLIRILYLLLVEKNVSRVALKLNQPQPSISASLRKLRELTGDPLLRGARGMVPTQHGESLLKPAKRILDETESLFIKKSPFVPEAAARTFHIAAPDYLDTQFLPNVVASIRRVAPNSRVAIHSVGPGTDYLRMLSDGEMDLVIANWDEPPAHLHMSKLFEDPIVCTMRADSPYAKRTEADAMTIEDYLSLPHVAPSQMLPGYHGVIDSFLARSGLHRKIAVESPYFGLIPLLLGLRAAWEAWQGEDDDELDDRKKVAPLTVAAVTFANGGDNIGVYVPVFLSVSPASILTYCAVFLLLVAVLVSIAKFVATRPGIDEALEKSEHILFPLVLIILGVVILVQGGAFGL